MLALNKLPLKRCVCDMNNIRIKVKNILSVLLCELIAIAEEDFIVTLKNDFDKRSFCTIVSVKRMKFIWF